MIKQKVCYGFGIFAVISVLFWAFTGMSLWAPVDAVEFRALALVTFHIAAIGAAVITYIER